VLLQIGFSLRFDPGYEKLKMMVQTGEIGRVFQLKSEYDIYVPDLTKSPMRELVEIGGRLKLFGSRDMGAWRMTDPRSGGGVFSDHGIHYTDLFRWIMEDEVVAVTGATQKIKPSVAFEDHASCFLRFASGASAFLEASLSRWSARNEIDQGLLHGERGCLKYKMDQSWYLLGFPHLNNIHARLWKYGEVAFALGRWMPVQTPYGKKYVMFKRQLDYFIAKIKGNYKPHPVFGEAWGATGRDGLRALEIAQAVYASNETNLAVSLA
jgi:predicted dehydrogenase